MQKYLTYEHPLNERVRTILRMEFLFRQIKHFMAGKTVWDSRAVLSALMDILTLFSRNDLKTELIKELERHAANLARLTEKSGVDHTQLKNILHWLDKLRKTLHNMDGQLAQALRDDEFLAAIRQRSSIPGGTVILISPFIINGCIYRRNSAMPIWSVGRPALISSARPSS